MRELGDQRRAIERLERKRDFTAHLAVYLIVNAGLVVIWALTSAGYFWPLWPILGWGIGVALHAWDVFGRRPITEERIRAEMARDRR